MASAVATCPNPGCRMQTSDGESGDYCRDCGTSLSGRTSAADNLPRCPKQSCGEPQAPDANFCKQCGTRTKHKTKAADVTFPGTWRHRPPTPTPRQRRAESSKDLPPKSDSVDAFARSIIKMSAPLWTQNIEQNLKTMKDNVFRMLKHSGFLKTFPLQLKRSDVVSIGNESSQFCSDEISDIKAKLFFRKLIMLNHNVREDFDLFGGAHTPRTAMSESRVVQKTFSDIWFEHKNADAVNPLDHFLMAYLSCDPFLRQVFVYKAAICRLAIPIIYPSPELQGYCECALWPLRFLEFEGKTSEGELRDMDAASTPMHFVTFCRYGSTTTFTKSHLLNRVLSEGEPYPTFHCWGQTNSDRPRVISNGIVDGSWYIPACYDSDFFNDPIMFLNLRGDCRNHKCQIDILRRLTTMFVVVVDVEYVANRDFSVFLNTVHPLKHQPLLVLTNDKRLTLDPSQIQSLEQIALKAHIVLTFQSDNQRTQTGIVMDLRKAIAVETQSAELKSLSNDFSLEPQSGAITDENSEMCQSGKFFALNIKHHVKLTENSTFADIKTSINHIKVIELPLQGSLWRNLSSLEKMQFRPERKGDPHEVTIDDIARQMKAIRDQQQIISKTPGPMMQSFLEAVDQCIEDTDMKKSLYFLNWVKIYLDSLSRLSLPDFIQNCRDKWSTLQDEKRILRYQSDTVKKRHQDLLQAEKELADASFGLEHLFRELGQIVEASVFNHPRKILDAKCKSYARWVASLVLDGLALELMDGDAANIPLEWLKAVFNELKDLVGKKNVFVVSVLGIQSSGKSTLLNTMFGVQFAVGAARCTKGVFMQVLPVEEDNDLPFQYVCIIDSEGLRAPELSGQSKVHDNPLATLVIGLGDVTLINIKGENYAEMQDILQIAVHAFLRMKLVKLNHQRCLFIHQNVAAATAKHKMKFGCQKLQECLDEMATEAGKQEGQLNIKTFDQVIKFDCRTDVHFFPDFWHGNPPMAHANPKYSSNVLDVRLKILNEFGIKAKGYLQFNHLWDRIRDIWTAILKEDFVFSFRNTLEVRAYTNFERKLQKVIPKKIVDMFEKCLQQCEAMIVSCQTHERLESCHSKLKYMIEQNTTDVQNAVATQVDRIIEEDEYSGIITSWRDDFINSMTAIAQAEKQIAKEQIQTFHHCQQAEINAARLKVIDLAKKDLSYDALRQIFNEHYGNDFEYTLDVSGDISSRIKEAIYNRVGRAHWKDISEELKDKTFSSCKCEEMNESFDIRTADISISYDKHLVIERQNVEVCCVHAAQQIVKSIFDNANAYLENLPKSKLSHTSFIDGLITEAIECLYDKHDIAYKAHGITFSFLPALAARAIIHICMHAYDHFCEMEDHYSSITALSMDESRERAFEQFHKNATQHKDESVILQILRKVLKERFKISVKHSLPGKIKQQIKRKFPSKLKLMNVMLKDLAERQDYDEFQQYFKNPLSYAYLWVQKNEMMPIQDTKQLSQLAVAILENMSTRFLNRFRQMNYYPIEHDRISVKSWIDNFFIVNLSRIDPNSSCTQKRTSGLFRRLGEVRSKEYSIKDLKGFHHKLKESFEDISSALIDEFDTIKLSDLDYNASFISQIVDDIWGCQAQCPFCGEPCLHETCDHVIHGLNHQCVTHRPMAIAGRVKDKKSNVLTSATCSQAVADDGSFQYVVGNKTKEKRFRHYKRCYADWDIHPDRSGHAIAYWQWFFTTFYQQFSASHPMRVLSDIPENWQHVRLDDALFSIDACIGQYYREDPIYLNMINTEVDWEDLDMDLFSYDSDEPLYDTIPFDCIGAPSIPQASLSQSSQHSDRYPVYENLP